MSYKRRTTFFGIPVPASGDFIEGSEELRKANIIENQLIAATKGIMTTIFEDGDYTYVKEADGKYTVRCSSTGQRTALTAILNGGLAQTYSTIKWTGMVAGEMYWLSIEFSEEMYVDETAFRVVYSPSPSIWGNKKMLLATLDLRNEGAISLDSNPAGKVYSKDIETHVGMSENPHGVELVQDLLRIRKQARVIIPADSENEDGAIYVDDLRTDKPTIETNGEMRFKDKNGFFQLSDENAALLFSSEGTIVGALNELHVRPQVKAMDIVSGGTSGVLVEVENAAQILVVSIHEKAGQGFTFPVMAGTIVVGYNGDDSSVDAPNKFMVYNNGATSIGLRAMVVYR